MYKGELIFQKCLDAWPKGSRHDQEKKKLKISALLYVRCFPVDQRRARKSKANLGEGGTELNNFAENKAQLYTYIGVNF